MQLKNKLVLFIKAIKKLRSPKSIITAGLIYKEYGMIGLKKAILNKATGNSILSISKYSIKDDNNFGNRILKKQQSEINQEIFNNDIKQWKIHPLISVVMPIYNPPIKWLKIAIESLQNQIYTNWELCAVDDGSTNLDGVHLLEKFAKLDNRIRLYKSDLNGGISKASNKSIELANGEYIALLDQDDEIPRDAFYWFVKTINNNPKADFIYSDECKIPENDSKEGFDFLFKADWSPYLLINNMFIGHLVMYKTELLRKYGGFDSNFDFGQDYELAVRMGDCANCIVHIPRILYFWRALPTSTACGGKSFSNKINMAVPCEWLRRNGIFSNIKKNMHYNYPIILGDCKKVSIIEAPKSFDDFKNVLEKIIENTNYKNYEIVVVAEEELLLKIKKEYPYISNIFFIKSEKNIAFLEKLNIGAEKSSGEILIFMTDNCIPLNKEWLDRMVDTLILPKVGAVSPAILDNNLLVKWAGSAICFDNNYFNIMGSPYQGQSFYDNYQRYLLSPQVSKECLSLSRDCIAISKDLFFKVDKFDIENTTVYSFNEDISFKIQDLGMNCCYTSNAQCMNIKDNSEDILQGNSKYLYLLNKWAKYYNYDPFFSDMMLSQLICDDRERTLKFYLINEENAFSEKRKMIVFSHELSRTGAPIVILDAVKELISDGWYVMVVSPFDGELREEYNKLGVSVIIDFRLAWTRGEKEERSSFNINWYMDKLIKEFDCLLIGTLMGHNLIARYQRYNIPILWWIHEGSYSLEFIHKVLPKNLNKNVHVFCGGKYVQDMLNRYHIFYKNNILLYGVEDIKEKYKKQNINNKNIKFLIAGTIDERKGQDIVIKAIEKLPREILKNLEFIFVGKPSFGNVYDKLKKKAAKYENIKIMKQVSREKLFELYNEIDCLLCASRDDPMPVVATEAMMLYKPCLCSTGTGTSRYIVDNKNGFIFKNENVEDLVNKIEYIVENRTSLNKIGLESRKIYETNFSEEIFKLSLKKILRDING